MPEENLRTRGHQVQVLTSKHGMTAEQTGGDVERRLVLNGAFDHPLLTGYRELQYVMAAHGDGGRVAIAGRAQQVGSVRVVLDQGLQQRDDGRRLAA